MKRLAAGCANVTVLALLMLAAMCGCASDVSLLRKAQSAYTIAERKFDARCVSIPEPKAPVDCPGEEEKLLGYYRELSAQIAALLIGPLPKDARTRLKAIPDELAPPKEKK